jgi:hypothetical protein
MSFVTVLMAAMTGFVLLAPLAMVTLLVIGGVPVRQPAAAAASRRTACACGEPGCGQELALSRAA